MRSRLLCVGVGAAAVLLGSARAEACECPTHSAAPVWPSNGAVGVAIDTPLVVGSTDLDLAQLKLFAEDGEVIALEEQHRALAPGPFACERFSYNFSKPSKELEANTSYTFTAHIETPGDGDSGPQVFERTVSFMTGTERRAPTPPEVHTSLFGAQAGSMLLDLFLETASAEPIFLLAHGEKGVLVHDLDPLFDAQPYRVSFGNVPCATFTIFDVTGASIADQTSCKPSKCTSVSSLGSDGCGGESFPGLSWSDWQALPDGCDSETSPHGSLDAGSETLALSPTDQAITPLPASAGSGCNFAAQHNSGSACALSGLLIAALLRTGSARRRR
jgi:hypothetical protein